MNNMCNYFGNKKFQVMPELKKYIKMAKKYFYIIDHLQFSPHNMGAFSQTVNYKLY